MTSQTSKMCVLAISLGLAASAAQADFVILDDLIVDGSACIGTACVNGESFGTDTLRLKETTLRLKFQDTSVGSFPSTDWQLTANESPSGGLNKFSIDDTTGGRTPFTIEAGAANHSLYVDDAGRIGVGTSAPATEIHAIDGDTATLRLQQDGSSGFATQTWDLAGNEVNFFIRDVSNGGALPFRIRPSAPNDALVVDDSGEIGMGIANPSAALHVRRADGTARVLVEEASTSTSNNRILMQLTNNGAAQISLSNIDDSTDWRVQNFSDTVRISKAGTGTTEFELDASGNLEIRGELITSGSCSVGCDRVFDEDYDLLSIEEHAELMWQNKYLPNVGPTAEQGAFNMSQKTLRMLNELEQAHIYIEQLHLRLEALEAQAGIQGG